MILDYDLARDEAGTGDILSIDLHGHGHELADIEWFLARHGDELFYDWHDRVPTTFDVVEVWRRSVPIHDPGGEQDGWRQYVYQGKPGRGAKAVTSLQVVYRLRERWCVHHLWEPGDSGIPANWLIDGEAIVARELARAAGEVEPRHTAEPPYRVGGYSHPGQVWLCRACAADFVRRHNEAPAAAHSVTTPKLAPVHALTAQESR